MRISDDDGDVVLEAIGVESYAELYELNASEVLARIDAKRAPLHPGDAFLAVIVLRAVADLTETTQRLDKARTRLDWTTLVAGAGRRRDRRRPARRRDHLNVDSQDDARA